MWNDLPQNLINWVKRLRACVKAGGRHFEHPASKKLFLHSFELLASCDSLKRQISMFLFDFNTSTMMKIVIFIVVILLHDNVVT